MWDNKGWKRITAEEAARLHPGGRVSAHSGLFMCELCGQYVLLTDSNINVRHFRHSSAEKSKDCPERTFGPGVTVTFNSAEHELPIKIVNITPSSFSFELGLIRIPLNLFSSKMQIEIQGSESADTKFVYSGERIDPEHITYVSIGQRPCEDYHIKILSGDSKIAAYWPKSVSGINPFGTLFDAASGKKLPYDADVVVDKEYYLLAKYELHIPKHSHIQIQKVCVKNISWSNWYLYKICASDFDEESARFFLDYHCRLSDNPISITPVWPIYVKEPYLIKHCGKMIFLHVKGNVSNTSVFPSAHLITHQLSDSALVEVFCNSRQQLISAGRSKALKYSYFWKVDLNNVSDMPSVIVTDVNNNSYEAGVYNTLPSNTLLTVKTLFDGKIVIKQKNRIVSKQNISAGVQTDIARITWDYEISVFVGMDAVWTATFQRHSLPKSMEDESELLCRLQKYRGHEIMVPSSIGQISMYLNDYPRIREWISLCKVNNTIDERAYKELRSFVLNKKVL